MPSFKLYIVQDGAHFYSYRDADCTNHVRSLDRVAPFPVKDNDNESAEKARNWFIGLMSHGQRYEFVGA